MRAAQEAGRTSETRLRPAGTRLKDPAQGPHNRRSLDNRRARPRGRAGAPPTSSCRPRAAPPLLSAAAAAAATTRSSSGPLLRLTLQPCSSGTLEDPPDSARLLFTYRYFVFFRRASVLPGKVRAGEPSAPITLATPASPHCCCAHLFLIPPLCFQCLAACVTCCLSLL